MEGTKDSNVKRFCSQNILVILGFSSIIAVIALIAVGVSQNKPLPENFKYGIVLDAGSTHTNLYIYKWPAEKNNNTGVVQQVEECIVKGPGISKFSNKIHALETYLDTCLDKCKKVIPKSLHPETPVYLGATAGMRLLSMKDEQLAHSVLDEVAKSISDYPFEFRGARILTGQEEGAYGWITINYLLGKFVQKSKWLGLLTGGRERTFGALDLGGASTQITFEPESLPIEGPENAVQFRLYGKDYTVYTHSFLCYGKNEALQLKLAKDIEASSKGILRDPCFHLGFEMFVNVSKLYSSPCARRYEKTLPFDKFQVQGTGNYQQCGQSVLELFNTSYCPYSHCAFNGIPLPPVKGKFGAFSAFQYVMQFLNMTSKHVTTEAMMNEAMERYCSRTWQEIKESYPEVHEGFLSEYCFAGTYILTLLLQGYHFTESSFKDIEFMGEERQTQDSA